MIKPRRSPIVLTLMVMTWLPPLAYLAGRCMAYDFSFLAPDHLTEDLYVWAFAIAAILGCMLGFFSSTSRRSAIMAPFAPLLSVLVSQAASLAYFKIVYHIPLQQSWSIVPSRFFTLCLSTHAASLVLAIGKLR